jgi:hypothetical protein
LVAARGVVGGRPLVVHVEVDGEGAPQVGVIRSALAHAEEARLSVAARG